MTNLEVPFDSAAHRTTDILLASSTRYRTDARRLCWTKTWPKDKISEEEKQHQTYLLLSVRHILLCRVTNKSVSYTKPELLFDGVHPASDKTIELLLMATHNCRSSHTRLYQLAPELQYQISSHIS